MQIISANIKAYTINYVKGPPLQVGMVTRLTKKWHVSNMTFKILLYISKDMRMDSVESTVSDNKYIIIIMHRGMLFYRYTCHLSVLNHNPISTWIYKREYMKQTYVYNYSYSNFSVVKRFTVII